MEIRWKQVSQNNGKRQKYAATGKCCCARLEEEEDVTAVPAKARLISQLSNQATVQTKHEADMGVIEDMYKARTRFNNYRVKKKGLQRVHE